MRCLILGGDGMLGHQLLKSWGAKYDVRVTLRQPLAQYERFGLFTAENAFDGVDVRNTDRVLEVIAAHRPNVVVNAAGVIKQRPAASESLPSLEINAVFPHRLRLMCKAMRARMVHISTDCVFSGRAGGYSERDIPDPVDLYGRSKLLGEVADGHCLTVRTSIIGRELSGASGLLEWFLAQEQTVRGFRRAIFSGLTTEALARVVAAVISEHPGLRGIRHVASAPISKHDLLCMLRDAYGSSVEVVPDDDVVCDRSLDGSRFEQETGLRAPRWTEMVAQLAADTTPYERLRSSSAC